MKKILLFLLVSFSLNSFSQEEIINVEQVKGTFQLEITNKNVDPISITTDLLLKIDSLRDESKVTYLNIDASRRIKIFSKNDLNLGKNKGIEDYVIVTSFKK
jgi:hypothetical protein